MQINLRLIFALNPSLHSVGESCKEKHTCLEASEEEQTSFPKFPFNCNIAVKIEVLQERLNINIPLCRFY